MAHLQVQCQNCGKRYKLPETFASDKAKCKACGNTIDVAAARAAGATEEAAAPATSAKPRAASSGGTRKPRQTAAKPSSRRSKSDDEAKPSKVRASSGRGSSRRRGRGERRADRRGGPGDGPVLCSYKWAAAGARSFIVHRGGRGEPGSGGAAGLVEFSARRVSRHTYTYCQVRKEDDLCVCFFF